MKITVELPEELLRRAKAEAALRGRKLKDLVEEGLRLVVDSGVADLGSSPKHLKGFGRGARRNR